MTYCLNCKHDSNHSLLRVTHDGTYLSYTMCYCGCTVYVPFGDALLEKLDSLLQAIRALK